MQFINDRSAVAQCDARFLASRSVILLIIVIISANYSQSHYCAIVRFLRHENAPQRNFYAIINNILVYIFIAIANTLPTNEKFIKFII